MFVIMFGNYVVNYMRNGCVVFCFEKYVDQKSEHNLETLELKLGHLL